MARYSTDLQMSGDHSHMAWNNEEFNFGVIYHNGIISIDEPGFYRISASVFSGISSTINLRTFINNEIYISTHSRTSPGFSYGFIYLELFDTIHFEKTGSSDLSGGFEQNYFTIEKIDEAYGKRYNVDRDFDSQA